MSIQLKPIPEQYKNADQETKGQLFLLAIQEALKSAVSEEQLKQFYTIEQISNLFINWNRSNQQQFKELEKRIAELEKPKSALEIKIEPKKEEPKEVPSTSWKEKLIKLLQK